MASTTVNALTAEEIMEALKPLSHWKYESNAITRVIEFQSFLMGIEFVNALAHMAERHNHHPDISIQYRNITLSYWTHTANGVTTLDITEAKEADQLISSFQKIQIKSD